MGWSFVGIWDFMGGGEWVVVGGWVGRCTLAGLETGGLVKGLVGHEATGPDDGIGKGRGEVAEVGLSFVLPVQNTTV